METSPAKKEFKNRFGQANHFLITTLVGLDGIQTGIIKEKPDTFCTSWNPRDVKRSAERSRVFVLKSFLGWAVESLEMYLTELNRKPKLLESENFTVLFSKAGQSVYKKTILIADEIQVDPVLTALMEVMITWRNYTFHYDIDNEIRESSLQCLKDHSEQVKIRFSGLEIEQLKKKWESNGDFTFKETASLIKATQDFVSEIDIYVLKNLDKERFFFDSIKRHFDKNENSLKRYESFDTTKKRKYLSVLLQNIAGETDTDEDILKLIIDQLKTK